MLMRIYTGYVDFKIIERRVLTIFTRCTSSIPKEYVIIPHCSLVFKYATKLAFCCPRNLKAKHMHSRSFLILLPVFCIAS